MADLERMIAAARRAMVQVLELVPSDRVLVVQDATCLACGEAFAQAARAEGCQVSTYLLPAERRPLAAMPEDMAGLVDRHDMVINAIAGSTDEVPFRIEWLELVEARKLRMGHSPGITEDMMDGGPMDVDYRLMAGHANRLLQALAGAVTARITTPAGTDLTLDISGRRFATDARISDLERGCNLPCGEVFCAPVEIGADGRLVADGPIGGEGPPPSPVTLDIKAGRVIAVSCADPGWQQRIVQLLDTDDGSRTIAELGIGLNPGARLKGRMLEDEKAYRTAHVAFGSNIGYPGGSNRSATHIDYLVHRPTMVVTREDGSRDTLLKDGELTV